jgi:3-dehydroquinate dehydratase/shikimate dehydrogenase
MTPALLCCTVAEPTMADLCRQRDRASAGADLVELRLDWLPGPIDVSQALGGRSKPVIVTCRPSWEGGAFGGSEEERHRVLTDAMRAGAEYVDVEWRAGFAANLVRSREGRGVVLSCHDFDGVPADLDALLAEMLAHGSEVVKVAVTAKALSDCLTLRRAASRRRTSGDAAVARGRVELVLVAMGPSGLATRVLPGRFGSSWTYAGQVAPGQLGTDQLLEMYRFRGLSDRTAIYGVAGRPVAQSLSPSMHNAWFRDAAVDAVYLPLDTDSADDLFAFAEEMGLEGASITAPLKTAVLAHLTHVDDVAARVGAANTIRRTSAGWEGTNTDVLGFLAPLRARAWDLRGARAAVLGAGGAARAVAVALAGSGTDVSIHARRASAASEVAALVGGRASASLPSPGSWDLLVNATPVGMCGSRGEAPQSFPAKFLQEAFGDGGRGKGRCVYDLVSTPSDTPLLCAARAAGCTTISGVEMLVAQAERQFEWWTGSGG